jgi:hypothetical protein
VNSRATITGTTNFNKTYLVASVPSTTTLTIEEVATPANETGLSATLKSSPKNESGLIAIANVISSGVMTIQPSRVEHMDGYFIVNNTRTSAADGVNTQQFYISDPEDGLTWNAANFSSAQRQNDSLLEIVAHGSDLFLFGENSTEAWYNSGSGDFPFEPARGTVIPWGIIGAQTAQICGDGVIWLSQRENGQVAVASMPAYQPMRVSTHEISYRLGTHTRAELEAATAFAYRDEGHDFYVMTVGNETLVFDAEESKRNPSPAWHERKSPYSTGDSYFRGKYHAFLGGKHIVSDTLNAKLLQMSLATHTDLDNATARAITRTGVSGD